MELRPGYKRTEVGVIPEGWAVTTLGKVAQFRTGPFGSALHKSDYTADGIPVINPMHIIDGDLSPSAEMSVTEEAARKLTDFRLKAGEVVLGRRGDMGRCALVQRKHEGWLCGTGSMIVRPGSAIEPGFLSRILSSPSVVASIEQTSVGSTMINLNQGTLRSLLVQLPPVSEQRAIATALSDVDALLTQLDRLIAKKRDIKQAAMQQLLTGKTRLPGFGGEWQGVGLREIATFRTGPFGSALHKSDYTFDGVPVINPMHIIDGKLVPTAAMSVTESAAQGLSEFRLRENDLVIGRRGEMGRCAVVKRESDGWLCGTGSMIVRTIGSVDPSYLQRVLASPSVVSAIEESSVGSTMINLNQEVLGSLTVQLPAFEEQTAIATLLSDLDAELSALKARRAKTRTLKQGMMQALLTGRTRLP
ncbi:MAG TPA: restriction endonuclease [Thauera sp.]|nr:restriction endonuclease [Thauera sp.]HHW62963.1 restriction endonuclease subunit S [Rhodocyclaceae bacterium]